MDANSHGDRFHVAGSSLKCDQIFCATKSWVDRKKKSIYETHEEEQTRTKPKASRVSTTIVS